MNAFLLGKRPLLTELNRVERFYLGGKLLNRWQGLPDSGDGHMSEEFLVSTVEYIGPGKPAENGVSAVDCGGELWNLRSLIESDSVAFLGERYAKASEGHAGVLARVGDSLSRLIIQCHPNDEQAKRFFGIPFGKTEAWYINDTRQVDGEKAHVYCGFKPGITRKRWEELFREQDSKGMLECLHRFDVEKGDCVLIAAGVPHAIGKGCNFIELHQPCDITLRTERFFTPQPLLDEQMHYGAGFDALFDCFNYIGYTRGEMHDKAFMKPAICRQSPGGTLFDLITYADTTCMSVKKLSVDGEFEMPPFDGHYLLITAGNPVVLQSGDTRLTVPQGRGVFVPAACDDLKVIGKAALIAAYPFSIL